MYFCGYSNLFNKFNEISLNLLLRTAIAVQQTQHVLTRYTLRTGTIVSQCHKWNERASVSTQVH